MYFRGQTFQRKTIMTLRSACLYDNGDIYQDSGLALPPLPLRSAIINVVFYPNIVYNRQENARISFILNFADTQVLGHTIMSMLNVTVLSAVTVAHLGIV